MSSQNLPTKFLAIIPVPESAGLPGHEDGAVIPYRLADGSLYGVAVIGRNKRSYRMYCSDGSRLAWRSQRFTKGCPLLHADRMEKFETVVMFPDEDAASIFEKPLAENQILASAWPESLSRMAAWNLLDGKDVVFWPNGESKQEDEIRGIATLLKSRARSIRICTKSWLPSLSLGETLETLAQAQPLTEVTQGSVDVFTPFPDVGPNGRPLSTIENVKEVMRRTGITARYDIFLKRPEIMVPKSTVVSDNAHNNALSMLISEASRLWLPTGNVAEFSDAIAASNPYNPIAQWITSKEWDGTSRLDDLYATVETTNNHLRNIYMQRWLVSAVAAVFEPTGISASGMLVFQGRQNKGKTFWFKNLVSGMAKAYIQDGLKLNPGDKDSCFSVLKNWLVELGELDATFRRSDIAELKAFITRERDTLRPPYARRESDYPRRTILFGSVNTKRFLVDDENRRFWSLQCDKITARHGLDMQQIWAEVKALYDNGEPWHLQADELLLMMEENKDFERIDPLREQILDTYEWESFALTQPRWKSATEILQELGFKPPIREGYPSKCGAIITELNGGLRQKGNQGRLLAVPQRRI